MNKKFPTRELEFFALCSVESILELDFSESLS